MNRLTLPAVLLATLLVVSAGAVGAVAAPLVSGDASATAMQEGDGNTTDTPTATPTPTGDQSANETNTSDGEPTFGAVVSSFMQTSAVDAENEVEDGLFAAQFERSNASERARLVRQRAGTISERIAELREERAALLGGENVTVRERAQAARLAEQSESLADSIEQTDRAAQRANVSLNRTALDELRTEARNLTGPEVAELARGLVDRDDSPRRGPPEDRGPDRGESETGENATDTETTSGESPTDRSGDAPGRDRSGGEANDGGTDGTADDTTETASPTPTPSADDGGSEPGAEGAGSDQGSENDGSAEASP